MKAMVLGATGMLGHKLMQRVGQAHEVWGTVRGAPSDAVEIPGCAPDRLIGGIRADSLDSVTHAITRVKPDVVINCIGIVKQVRAVNDPVASIRVNALFPQELALICRAHCTRLIHLSTDCVFSGRRGPYKQGDTPDPVDLYGRSKLLGEVDGPSCLTLRTSIVGRELKRRTGLLEWFMSQSGGKVRGYSRAFYSGLTTRAMADVIRMLIEDRPTLSGIWQISGDPISKLELLRLVNRIYGLGILIEEDNDFFCDRRLDSAPFRAETSYTPPSWEEMITEMHQDPLI